MPAVLDMRGKKGLVFGIANSQSIAYGCARIMRKAGAELGVTYLNDKAGPHVRPLASELEAAFCLPCDVIDDAQLRAVFEKALAQWGTLDFVLHSIAFAPKEDLHGRLTDCSREGFLLAMDISCHSFVRMARLAEAMMPKGGSLLTVSYLGSSEVVEHYAVMGPVKAALESAVRYLAAELGHKNIRVNALSPGPVPTRAASGIVGFSNLLDAASAKAPLHRLAGLDDIGNLAAFLASDLAINITGGVHFIDAGYATVD